MVLQITADRAAALSLPIVSVCFSHNRTKEDKTLISVMAEMAFQSPWKQMRVSKPWLSWCDPNQQKHSSEVVIE